MKGIDPKTIFNFLTNSYQEKELTTIITWMEEDSDNKEWLLKTKAFWDQARFKRVYGRKYQEEQFQKIWNKIHRLQGEKQKRTSPLKRIIGYAIAACSIGLIVGYGLLKLSQNKNNEGYIVENVTSNDSIQRIILPDHSIVWLNENSQIKYLPQFTERRVLLTGEAYFEVAYDKEKPFRVVTPDFTVKVLGTKFNVSSFEESNFSDATLISGKIAIENRHMKEILILNPSQKARYLKKTNSLVVENVDTESETAWRKSFISFEKFDIEQIMKRLEFIYNEPIILQQIPETYSAKTYSGSVARQDSLEGVLRSLQNIVAFNFTKTDEGIIISMKNK
ncbi:hypothetical protein SDC9_65397 [bioreactor metagenome]|uniref:FecR protein domain-containing protein n=1 Tax=bioreactor metagenome TaxID=1076179 RepID=A0A644XSC5_9ZZZZ